MVFHGFYSGFGGQELKTTVETKKNLVSTLACLSDLVNIPIYCLHEGDFPKFFVEV